MVRSKYNINVCYYYQYNVALKKENKWQEERNCIGVRN